jgi:hypothetical protein
MRSELRSNDGESAIALDLKRRFTYATEPGFEGSMQICGRHWVGDHTDDINVSIAGIWLRAEDLRELRSVVAGWLARPLSELNAELLQGEFQLARMPGQSVRIRFGSRPDVIGGRHVVVTVAFVAGPLSGEYYFLSDQSCLQSFSDELNAALDVTG